MVGTTSGRAADASTRTSGGIGNAATNESEVVEQTSAGGLELATKSVLEAGQGDQERAASVVRASTEAKALFD